MLCFWSCGSADSLLTLAVFFVWQTSGAPGVYVKRLHIWPREFGLIKKSAEIQAMVSLHFFGNMFSRFRCSYYGRIYFWGLTLHCKKNNIFLALKYSEVINASICIYLLLLSLNGNSVNKQFIKFRLSFGNSTDSH